MLRVVGTPRRISRICFARVDRGVVEGWNATVCHGRKEGKLGVGKEVGSDQSFDCERGKNRKEDVATSWIVKRMLRAKDVQVEVDSFGRDQGWRNVERGVLRDEKEAEESDANEAEAATSKHHVMTSQPLT